MEQVALEQCSHRRCQHLRQWFNALYHNSSTHATTLSSISPPNFISLLLLLPFFSLHHSTLNKGGKQGCGCRMFTCVQARSERSRDWPGAPPVSCRMFNAPLLLSTCPCLSPGKSLPSSPQNLKILRPSDRSIPGRRYTDILTENICILKDVSCPCGSLCDTCCSFDEACSDFRGDDRPGREPRLPWVARQEQTHVSSWVVTVGVSWRLSEPQLSHL